MIVSPLGYTNLLPSRLSYIGESRTDENGSPPSAMHGFLGGGGGACFIRLTWATEIILLIFHNFRHDWEFQYYI